MPSSLLTIQILKFLIPCAGLTTNQHFLQHILIFHQFCGQLPIGVQHFLMTPYFPERHHWRLKTFNLLDFQRIPSTLPWMLSYLLPSNPTGLHSVGNGAPIKCSTTSGNSWFLVVDCAVWPQNPITYLISTVANTGRLQGFLTDDTILPSYPKTDSFPDFWLRTVR